MKVRTGRRTQKSLGTGCMILFALPFAAVGVFMTGLTAVTITRSVNARSSWQPVPCRIVSVEASSGSGNDTTQTEATYTYSFAGRQYTGHRVSFHGGGDNIGSFQRRVLHELELHRDREEPLMGRVNPDHPDQSVLYPGIRWEMIAFYMVFGLVFGGVGFGLIFGGIWAAKKTKRENARKADLPAEPWRWKDEWAAGEIKSSGKAGMLVPLIFAGFWNLISWPIAIMAMLDEVMKNGNKTALLVLLFPAIGLLLAGWAVRAVLRWRKFGTSVFKMASVPGVIGGKLAGIISVPVHLVPEDGFHLSLRCVRRVTTGSGDNRRTSERVLWEDERTLTSELLRHDPSRSAIPVLFGIPFDCSPSDESHSDDQTIWRLQAEARVPGIDYLARFDVPVFETPESSRDFVLDESSMRSFQAERDPATELRNAGVVVTQRGARTKEFYFPPARSLGSAIGSTLFSAIWIGAIVLMLKFGAPILFPIVFGLFGVLIVWGTLEMWLSAQRIAVSRDAVRVRGGWLALGHEVVVPGDKLDDIKSSSNMQSGETRYYTLKLHRRDGKPVTLAKYIRGRRRADVIREALLDAMSARG